MTNVQARNVDFVCLFSIQKICLWLDVVWLGLAWSLNTINHDEKKEAQKKINKQTNEDKKDKNKVKVSQSFLFFSLLKNRDERERERVLFEKDVSEEGEEEEEENSNNQNSWFGLFGVTVKSETWTLNLSDKLRILTVDTTKKEAFRENERQSNWPKLFEKPLFFALSIQKGFSSSSSSLSSPL